MGRRDGAWQNRADKKARHQESLKTALHKFFLPKVNPQVKRKKKFCKLQQKTAHKVNDPADNLSGLYYKDILMIVSDDRK